MSIQLRDGFINETLERTLEDLLVRFIINCPDEDLSSIERVLFQIEEAQWFYEDFVRILNPLLPPLTMKSFCPMIIEQCPSIWPWSDDPKEALVKFRKYKSNIPVRGAALLNEKLDKLLLVKGTESSSWGFPRGKISKDESDVDCALRELKEETGFDATDYIDEDTFVERNIGGKNYKIYIISGVPESTEFIPEVRNEIAEIRWQNINKLANASGNYFLVKNMIKQIINFVNMNKKFVDAKAAEEELKKKATIQIKKLLGVGAENKIEEEQKLDPGRELLNMLHQAAKERQASTTEIPQVSNQDQLTTPLPQQQQNQQPQQQQLLPPFPFNLPPNGIPPMLNPNGPLPMLPFFPFALPLPQQQQIQQIMPPMFLPNGIMPPPQNFPFPVNFPLPPPPSSFNNVNNTNNNNSQVTPSISNVPDASSLSKPSFGLANKRSKEANSKELLSLLKSKPTVEELEPKRREESEKKEAQAASGNFLRGLFDKFKVNGPSNDSSYTGNTIKPIAILKREQPPQPEPPVEEPQPPKKFSILKRPDTPEGETTENKDNAKDLLNILNNKRSPSIGKSRTTTEAEARSLKAVEAYINGVSEADKLSVDSNNAKTVAPFKPMMLKRGDADKQENNDLLDILKGVKKETSPQPSEDATSVSQSSTSTKGSASLLDILKKPSVSSSKNASASKSKSSRSISKRNNPESLNLLNVFKSDEKSVDPSQSLLDLLQGNNEEKEGDQGQNENEGDQDQNENEGASSRESEEEGEAEGYETASEPEISEQKANASASLLQTLKSGINNSSAFSKANASKQSVNNSASLPESTQNKEQFTSANSSQMLLNVLHGNSTSVPAVAAETSPVPTAQDSSSMASKELLGLLKQPLPSQAQTPQAPVPSTNGSNELLNLLKSGPAQSKPLISATSDATSSSPANNGNELLSLLKSGQAQSNPVLPAPAASSNNGTNELLTLLKSGVPAQPNSVHSSSSGSNELLSLLKSGPSSVSGPSQFEFAAPASASSELLNLLKIQPQSTSINSSVNSGNNGNESLNILKGPSNSQAFSTNSNDISPSLALSDSQDLLSILKGGSTQQQQSSMKSPDLSLNSIASPDLFESQKLTDILKSNLSSPAPASLESQGPSSSSSELLSLLKGGNKSTFPTPASTLVTDAVAGQQIPPPQQYVFSNSDDEEDELEFEDFDELNF